MILRRAAVLALLAGCVVPPDIQEARPPPSNQPPFALRAWPEPGVIRYDRNCLDDQQLAFSLQGISDCDASDTVSVRWFVNYDPERPSFYAKSQFRGGPGVDQCMRSPSSDTFVLSRSDVPESEGVVQVEAVLSDGFADESVSPRYRAVQTGKALTRVGWTVELFEGPGCR